MRIRRPHIVVRSRCKIKKGNKRLNAYKLNLLNLKSSSAAHKLRS